MESPESRSIQIELVKGILIGTYHCETVDLETAKTAVNYRMKHWGSKDLPLLIHTNKVKHLTKEARDYLASKEGCEKIKSCAIITNSVITKVIANFFLNINKPLVPTKLFTNEVSAKKWLANFKT
ncbi:MAG: STAS/SEC14 domain-containing protein [Bacteroidota bacterium]